MIGFLRGKLADKQHSMVTLDVMGVGYELDVPLTTSFALPEAGAEVLLYTHMVVREDAQLLYGFLTQNDRDLFRQLIKVNGVGPKMAIAILSGLSTSDLVHCVEQQDISVLVKLPGIGKKTAERLLIELRDRVKAFSDLSDNNDKPRALQSVPGGHIQEEAESALIALGYKPSEATKMVKAASSTGATVEDIIKAALKKTL